MQAYNANEYYNNYIPVIEKTSQPLVTVNWSNLGEVFSLLEGTTLSEVANIIMGISIIFMMVVAAGIC